MTRSFEGRLERLERTAHRDSEAAGDAIVHLTDDERALALRNMCRFHPKLVVGFQSDENCPKLVELFRSTGRPVPWEDAELVGLLEERIGLPAGALQGNATVERVNEALVARGDAGQDQGEPLPT